MKDYKIDQYVSKHISNGDGWEIVQVNHVLEALDRHPDAVFLGMYVDTCR